MSQRLVDPVNLDKLEQRAAKALSGLRFARAEQDDQTRANDARRKIISGALCENHALLNSASEFSTVYIRLLKEYARPEERWLLADIFRALLRFDEAEALLVEGEAARQAADKARAEAQWWVTGRIAGPWRS
jgi:hypothetical protein